MVQTRPGVFPVDPETAVGRVRTFIGDVDYVAPTGYKHFSDAQIEAYIALTAPSEKMAVSVAMLALANLAAIESKSVKDYDLSVDLTKRAADLRAQAGVWREMADGDIEDVFEVFPVAFLSDVRPEATPAWDRGW